MYIFRDDQEVEFDMKGVYRVTTGKCFNGYPSIVMYYQIKKDNPGTRHYIYYRIEHAEEKRDAAFKDLKKRYKKVKFEELSHA
jgi:hypothetical protein